MTYRRSENRHWLLLLALGLVFQLVVVWSFYRHFDAAVLRLMPDDTFYYLKIAENIGNGLGSVFSAGEPTNGYHPLWMVLLSITHRLTRPTKELFVLWVLLWSVGWNIVAAYLLRRLLGVFGFSEGQSLLGVAGYLFLPWFVNLTLSGLETPLFFSCLFAFLLVAQRLLGNAEEMAWKDSLWLGATAGLVMLARTDAVFFTLLGFLVILIRRGWRVLPKLIVAGLLSTLLLAPWLLWNWMRFGTILQSSSIAMSLLAHSYSPNPLSIKYVKHALGAFRWIAYWAVYSPLIRHLTYQPRFPWLLYGIDGLVLAAVGAVAYRALVKRDLELPLLLWLPTLLVQFFYFGIRLFAQVWHMSTLFVLALVFLLGFVPSKVRVRAVALFVLLVLPVTVYSLANGYFRPQEREGRIGEVMAYHSDLGSSWTLCITDSGIPGYFGPSTTVNLDGVVNNQALEAIEQGRLSEYISSKDCDQVIIADQEARLQFYDRHMDDRSDP